MVKFFDCKTWFTVQASLRDSLVLPNCESISMPWMLAEKDDWVPRKDAPFIWLNHEPTEVRSHATATVPTHPEEVDPKDDASSKRPMPTLPNSSGGSEESLRAVASIDEAKQEPMTEASLHSQPSSSPVSESVHSEELRKPLLITEKLQEDASESRVMSPMSTSLRAVIPAGEQPQVSASSVGEDAKRKGGRRARMMDFGKRMGDKLEEKRRTIEEKGRHIVEKMRENARTNSMERTSS